MMESVVVAYLDVLFVQLQLPAVEPNSEALPS
jgi:hypothetical protein